MINLSQTNRIIVPLRWSGHQAKTVIDFLEEIVQTIWEIHEIAISEEYQKQSIFPVNNEKIDDLPF
jgi:hypothetical protein